MKAVSLFANVGIAETYFKDINVFFNISHSHTAVCCGVSEKCIGTDIQSIIYNYNDIIEMVMSPKEKESKRRTRNSSSFSETLKKDLLSQLTQKLN